MKNIIFGILSIISITSCEINSGGNDTNRIYSQVWVPVYAQLSEASDIVYQAPKPTVNAGKIYVYNQYVLQNEQYEGFHIIDHSNPSNPVKIGFLKVPTSTEIAIKNNFLYTNNLSDMVVISINNINQPTVVKRIPNAFPVIDQTYPPVDGYFQCTDPTKGTVVRWEMKQNQTATCRR